MKTSIVGLGQTEFSKNSGRSELKLATAAILAALEDAGLEVNDIDGLVRYTWDHTSEATIVNALGIPALKYYGETEFGGVNCCGAVAQASAAIEAGLASCVVFYRALNARSGVRFGRGERILDERDGELISRQPEPPGDIYSAPFGLLVPGQHHALYAQAYAGHYGLDDEDMIQLLGSVAVTQRAYANNNPRALLWDRKLTLDDYRAGRVISTPLRVYDFCLETDGAMAMVIVSRKRARSLNAKTVDVLAAGQHIFPGSVPIYLYGPRTYSLAPEAVGNELFGKAGVSRSDIDVAMIYDATSMIVPIALEDFGLIGRGESLDFYKSGQTGPGGALPVNTHGGQLSEGLFPRLEHDRRGRSSAAWGLSQSGQGGNRFRYSSRSKLNGVGARMTIIRPADEFLDQPFWQHLAAGTLHLNCCEDCGSAHHPPSPICPKCRSFNTGWRPATGRGRLQSFTEVRHPVHSLLEENVPYIVTLVELEEGVRMVSGIPKGMHEELKVGMPLQCQVVHIDDRFALPYFLPERRESKPI